MFISIFLCFTVSTKHTDSQFKATLSEQTWGLLAEGAHTVEADRWDGVGGFAEFQVVEDCYDIAHVRVKFAMTSNIKQSVFKAFSRNTAILLVFPAASRPRRRTRIRGFRRLKSLPIPPPMTQRNLDDTPNTKGLSVLLFGMQIDLNRV